MGNIRMHLDRVLLSDHEWKKKYCPDLYYAVTHPKEFLDKAIENYKKYGSPCASLFKHPKEKGE